MLLFAIAASGFGTALLAYAAWIWWGLRRPFNAARTPDDVWADVARARAARLAEHHPELPAIDRQLDAYAARIRRLYAEEGHQ